MNNRPASIYLSVKRVEVVEWYFPCCPVNRESSWNPDRKKIMVIKPCVIIYSLNNAIPLIS